MSDGIPIYGVTAKDLPALLATLPAAAAAFVTACGFKAAEGHHVLVPGEAGDLAAVLFGVEADEAVHRDPFLIGKLAGLLPAGLYRYASGIRDPFLATLGWHLSAYRFTRFRKAETTMPELRVPDDVDGERVATIAQAIALGRDLINRPANDLTPSALEEAARALAETHGASFAVIRGDDLLTRNFPLIHAVGRAATEAPRLVDFTWGDPAGPKVTLVGKGVCFDTGGLDIKPSSGMILMKKDMGGAATALALAAMIMRRKLPVRLRVLVPIVENAIAGNAFRPGDVISSRKGKTVEIGNTDAEGRLILADALALADEEAPTLLFDFATLTGAARVALGPDLPPFYTMDNDLALAIARHGAATNDPVWRMPLWDPYDALLKSKVADLNNISGGPFAGSVTAALFLRRFVEKAGSWVHFDVYGWSPATKPGRPEGGAVQAAHLLFDLLETRFGPGAGAADDMPSQAAVFEPVLH
ncbi:M17 family metallopeptidase [Beijerinckia sp. L45]|uniref:leucyl aminopeptidase family protein n=1 Tax=Beijerinckia sp. L45 TaxID=1641855 RepID=UPI001FEEE323|nr:leucyl aminopeptidase family protein [Beijerinckia sp. L45]